MNVCIVENNIIVNVIVIPEADDPAAYGGVALPEGKWIGDKFDDSIPDAPEEEFSVWDELDAAYQEGYSEGYTEGVNGAYDQ